METISIKKHILCLSQRGSVAVLSTGSPVLCTLCTASGPKGFDFQS